MVSPPIDRSETPPAPTATAFLLLHPEDNVLICTRSALAGEHVLVDGTMYRLTSDVALGHKIARRSLAVGDKVIRYGAPIGTMFAAVAPGDHVHVHNLASDYLPAHSRQGDTGEVSR